MSLSIGPLLRGRAPGQLVIQLTDRCNAQCPQCGMRTTEKFERATLPSDDVYRIIDAAADKGVQAISFTGGEPMMLMPQLADYIRRAGAAGIPYIRTGTNGYFFAGCGEKENRMDRVRKIADELADTPLRNFWISLDSAEPAVHEEMRGFPGVVSGIEAALPEFHRRGLFPSVNLGINRNISRETMTAGPLNGDPNGPERFYGMYREAFRAFYRRVIHMGFTIVNSCYPMSVEAGEDLSAVYAATAADGVVRFSPAEKAALFRALMDTIPEFRSQIRIFSPRTSLQALVRQYGEGNGAKAYPCRGGIDFFFVDARDGGTYPCGYRGDENLGKFWDVDLNALAAEAFCKACDWECFRDPSELFGPLLDTFSAPVRTARKLFGDAEFRGLWTEDLRYYRACEMFDGRQAPNFQKMSRFSGKPDAG